MLYNILESVTKFLNDKVKHCQWTLSTMTSKSKNGDDSWGTLHGRPMHGLAFCYDKHEEITTYIRMRCSYALSSNGNTCVLLAFKILDWFCYSRCHTVQFNI